MTDDDVELFRKAVSGARPLRSDERVDGAARKPKPKARFSRADETAALRESLEADIDTTMLDEFCKTNMARFKRPKQWRIAAALPKNNYGKIVKRELRSWLEREND